MGQMADASFYRAHEAHEILRKQKPVIPFFHDGTVLSVLRLQSCMSNQKITIVSHLSLLCGKSQLVRHIQSSCSVISALLVIVFTKKEYLRPCLHVWTLSQLLFGLQKEFVIILGMYTGSITHGLSKHSLNSMSILSKGSVLALRI